MFIKEIEIVLNDHLGSNYIQNCVTTNHVIKRLRCMYISVVQIQHKCSTQLCVTNQGMQHMI